MVNISLIVMIINVVPESTPKAILGSLCACPPPPPGKHSKMKAWWWLCVVMQKCYWVFTVIDDGYWWLSMVMESHWWLSMVVGGYVLLSMVMDGYWVSLIVINNYGLLLMVIEYYGWLLMGCGLCYWVLSMVMEEGQSSHGCDMLKNKEHRLSRRQWSPPPHQTVHCAVLFWSPQDKSKSWRLSLLYWSWSLILTFETNPTNHRFYTRNPAPDPSHLN